VLDHRNSRTFDYHPTYLQSRFHDAIERENSNAICNDAPQQFQNTDDEEDEEVSILSGQTTAGRHDHFHPSCVGTTEAKGLLLPEGILKRAVSPATTASCIFHAVTSIHDGRIHNAFSNASKCQLSKRPCITVSCSPFCSI
jgi:hypothetical protein